MRIKKPADIPPREITPRAAWLDRRKFLAGAGALASPFVTAAVFRKWLWPTRAVRRTQALGVPLAPPGPWAAPERGDDLNSWEDITTYNNYYELGTAKHEPAERAHTLRLRPWTVTVDGLVARPRTFGIEDLLARFPLEERVYRLRCVEAWSMVIPWVGFPLASLVAEAQPLGSAKYVRMETLHDPEQLPGQKGDVLDWPYVEGLRMDEATHPLTLLAVGLYGETLPGQNGAPIRLVVPWKYGFKGVKSIVRVSFVEEQPETTWMRAIPSEYGFYSNVNPEVAHRRWSQATERRIGEFSKRKTLMFNGYADQVAHLYAGMDLRVNF